MNCHLGQRVFLVIRVGEVSGIGSASIYFESMMNRVWSHVVVGSGLVLPFSLVSFEMLTCDLYFAFLANFV